MLKANIMGTRLLAPSLACLTGRPAMATTPIDRDDPRVRHEDCGDHVDERRCGAPALQRLDRLGAGVHRPIGLQGSDRLPRFVGQSAYGNDEYLDDVTVTAQ